MGRAAVPKKAVGSTKVAKKQYSRNNSTRRTNKKTPSAKKPKRAPVARKTPKKKQAVAKTNSKKKTTRATAVPPAAARTRCPSPSPSISSTATSTSSLSTATLIKQLEDLQLANQKHAEESKVAEARVELEGLYRVASEFARKHGFLNPCPNPVATTGESGTMFKQGLLAKGYSSIRDLLDHPDHYNVGFHGTSTTDAIVSILQHGFDPTRRARQVHGPGEYFDIGEGKVSTSYAGSTNCQIVAILIVKDRKGKKISEYKTANFTRNADRPIAILNNPAKKKVAQKPRSAPKKTSAKGKQAAAKKKAEDEVAAKPHHALCIPCAVVSDSAASLADLKKKVLAAFGSDVTEMKLQI